MSKVVRTRFAPSPTGYMHIGNLRTAIYEYLIAKVNQGKFILRIEDTDQERYIEDAEKIIYKTLKLVGLVHDEGPDIGGDFGPYVQSQRKDSYLPFAKKLVEEGKAYYCFCTKEKIAEDKAQAEKDGKVYIYDGHCSRLSQEEIESNLKNNIPYVIRQKMPKEGVTMFDDVVYGEIKIDNSELEDQILIKSDGYPTYNFANVIDDHLMGITHVVRGSEYLTSTPKYNLLYQAFGWEIPTYIHLPLIVKPDGSKISKRAGDASFEDLVEQGYLPEAILNYIVLLGWAPEDNKEIFSLKELEQCFNIKRISKSPAAFDIVKLNWFNAEYFRNMSDEEFYKVALPYMQKVITNPEINLMDVSKILKVRVETLVQIPEKIQFIENMPDYDLEIYKHKKMKTDFEISLKSLEHILPIIDGIDEWTEENIHQTIFDEVPKLGVRNGQLLWPIRTAVSGEAVSPGGAIELVHILGKKESVRRIKIGIEKLKSELGV